MQLGPVLWDPMRPRLKEVHGLIWGIRKTATPSQQLLSQNALVDILQLSNKRSLPFLGVKDCGLQDEDSFSEDIGILAIPKVSEALDTPLRSRLASARMCCFASCTSWSFTLTQRTRCFLMGFFLHHFFIIQLIHIVRLVVYPWKKMKKQHHVGPCLDVGFAQNETHFGSSMVLLYIPTVWV